MAFNVNKALGMLEEINKETSTKFETDPRIWRPTPGDNKIRIIPLTSSPDFPFIKLYFHYKVCQSNGGNGKLSLLNFNERDPIVEKAISLIKKGNQITYSKNNPDPNKGKEFYFLGRDLLGGKKDNARKGIPVERFHCLIIDRNNETDMKLWQFGEGVYKEILQKSIELQATLEEFNQIQTGEEIDITDPVKGYDLTVTYTPGNKSQSWVKKNFPTYDGPFSENEYAQTSIKFEKKPTVITTNKELGNKIINNQLDVFDIYKKPTFNELVDDLNVYMAMRESEGQRTDAEEQVSYNTKQNKQVTPVTEQTAQSTTTQVNTSQDVQNKFAALFD